jgi:hypothetical protein
MKPLEECLFEYVTAVPGIISIVGSRAWLFQDFFAQNQMLPAVAYALENDQSYETQQGPSALRRALYHFGVFAETADAGMQLAEAIREALDGYKGAMGDRDYVVALFDGMSRSRDSEMLVFTVDMRFLIFYQQPKN